MAHKVHASENPRMPASHARPGPHPGCPQILALLRSVSWGHGDPCHARPPHPGGWDPTGASLAQNKTPNHHLDLGGREAALSSRRELGFKPRSRQLVWGSALDWTIRTHRCPVPDPQRLRL